MPESLPPCLSLCCDAPATACAAAAEDKPKLDDVCKVDTTNSEQLELLWAYFSHNMAAINFWLATCVLPGETGQYPKRLAASAWDLADSPDGRVVGFSGTNDNHRLLPLQVHQAVLDEPELAATNGKMLELLLQVAQYKTLQPKVGAGRPRDSSCDIDVHLFQRQQQVLLRCFCSTCSILLILQSEWL